MAIAATNSQLSIALRWGVVPWPLAAINIIATNGKREWKKNIGYHCRSLVENRMDRFKMLTGHPCRRRRSTLG